MICAPPREDETFEQRVGRESIGTVNPRARHFAYRKKPWDRRSTPQVCLHAAHPIMSGRRNGNGFVTPIETVLTACGIDTGKPSRQELRTQLGRVQQYWLSSLRRHLHRNPARYNITRCELGIGMKGLHKSVT